MKNGGREKSDLLHSLIKAFLLAAFVERGERHIGAEWAKKWVESRIVPVGRQNIGQILRENHWERYDEFALLVKNQGRSCQDECYIEECFNQTGKIR